jgi:hypothetical protein
MTPHFLLSYKVGRHRVIGHSGRAPWCPETCDTPIPRRSEETDVHPATKVGIPSATMVVAIVADRGVDRQEPFNASLVPFSSARNASVPSLTWSRRAPKCRRGAGQSAATSRHSNGRRRAASGCGRSTVQSRRGRRVRRRQECRSASCTMRIRHRTIARCGFRACHYDGGDPRQELTSARAP